MEMTGINYTYFKLRHATDDKNVILVQQRTCEIKLASIKVHVKI